MTRYIPDDSDVTGGESASRCERCGAIENGQEHCYDYDDDPDDDRPTTIATPEQRRVLAAHGFPTEAHDGPTKWDAMTTRYQTKETRRV